MTTKATIHDCSLIPVKSVSEARGCLGFLQEGPDLPFIIKRTYFIYNVPGEQLRGGHACLNSETMLICLQGEVSLQLFDGREEKHFTLNSADTALYRPSGLYLEQMQFKNNAIMLGLASTLYDDTKYIYGRENYLRHIAA